MTGLASSALSGPAGAACAAHLGQLGVQDVVLVDRHDFPRDKTCGSGISPKGIQTLKDLGVWHEIEPHSYPINGIRIVKDGIVTISVLPVNDKEVALIDARKAAAMFAKILSLLIMTGDDRISRRWRPMLKSPSLR